MHLSIGILTLLSQRKQWLSTCWKIYPGHFWLEWAHWGNCRILCPFKAVPLEELDTRLRDERRVQPSSRNGKYISGAIRGYTASVDPSLSQEMVSKLLGGYTGKHWAKPQLFVRWMCNLGFYADRKEMLVCDIKDIKLFSLFRNWPSLSEKGEMCKLKLYIWDFKPRYWSNDCIIVFVKYGNHIGNSEEISLTNFTFEKLCWRLEVRAIMLDAFFKDIVWNIIQSN